MTRLFKKRQQLFEIQDFSWTPAAIRNGITDYLQFLLKEIGLYNVVAPLVLKLLKTSHQSSIIDLCSGGGGPMIHLMDSINNLEDHYQLTLTDLYPNQESFNYHQSQNPETINIEQDSIDARNVPTHLTGVRTLFTSFHHFNDEDALGILKDAQAKNMPIGIFEFTDRNLLTFLLCLPSFLGMFLLMPLVRPFKWSRLFWTYIIPMIPLITLWDICASVLRTRTTDELEVMAKNLNSENYQWVVGKIPTTLKFNIVYLLGLPKNKIGVNS